jgi:hypothetical protein
MRLIISHNIPYIKCRRRPVVNFPTMTLSRLIGRVIIIITTKTIMEYAAVRLLNRVPLMLKIISRLLDRETKGFENVYYIL